VSESVKLVTAIVKPFKLDQILEALARVGIVTLTVTETKGYGQTGQTELYRGMEFTAKFLPMLKIEVAVAAHRLDKVIAAILGAAKTGLAGDGKIFVCELNQIFSVRTGGADKTAPPLAA